MERLRRALAVIEVLIRKAEAELASRRKGNGHVPDPNDPDDLVRDLEIWLAALRAARARLMRTLARLAARR